MATKKYVMLVDAERCVNCKACVTACRAEWNTPLGHSRNWVDPHLSTGCEFCVDVRPYNARFRNAVNGIVSKCTFYQPRIDAWEDPACVNVCFTRALMFEDHHIRGDLRFIPSGFDEWINEKCEGGSEHCLRIPSVGQPGGVR